MRTTINICEGRIMSKNMLNKIIDLLINKADLDKRFFGKTQETLNSNELKEIFIAFEKNYGKIRKYFKNGEYTFPESFDEFKKIFLGKCQEKYSDYKENLFQELSKNNKKEFISLINKETFLYLCSETSSGVWEYILGEIENKKTFAKTLNETSKKGLKNLIYIINTIDNSKKLGIIIEKLGNQMPDFLTKYNTESMMLLIKKMGIHDIQYFFDIKNYGNKQLEITLYMNYIEKIIDLIQYIGCQFFLLSIENIDTKMLAELIDRTSTKEFGKMLLKKTEIHERKPENTQKMIKETNNIIGKKYWC